MNIRMVYIAALFSFVNVSCLESQPASNERGGILPIDAVSTTVHKLSPIELTEGTYSCANGKVFENELSVGGIAKVGNRTWLKDYLVNKIKNSPDALTAKTICHNQGYAVSQLHSLNLAALPDKGVEHVEATAKFVCCDNDNNPATKPRPKGPALTATGDKCSIFFGHSWRDADINKIPLRKSKIPERYEGIDRNILSFTNSPMSLHPIESDLAQPAHITGNEARLKALNSLRTTIVDVRRRCSMVPRGQYLTLNAWTMSGPDRASDEPYTAIENFANPLAVELGLCCINVSVTKEEQEAPLGR